ncbi:2-phosphosulfolactate phosphatase [Nocardia sp. NPDC059240]|uniref:2-phosphosulfolactate phosphatase n=1 Tax=Nocardia sp. NPDC059240 TaxID=3346786 RepID=UPI0036BC543C
MAERPEWARQVGAGVRFEWGLTGARVLGPECAAIVVVDVLSFTTAVSVAIDAGTRVFPYPARDHTAGEFALAQDARLAVGRRAVTAEHPWSLSPAALRSAPVPERLVLPSPNGSAIAAAVGGVPVIAACLRNATAVGQWIVKQGWGTAERPVGVIAAGEHWPGREVLRPAIEDLLGAAAVIDAMVAQGVGPLSAEARSARNAYLGERDVAATVTDCASGRELAAIGFGADVAAAVEIDSSSSVPVLADGAFADATA